MRFVLHIAFVLFGCIQAACAPVFVGRVFCSTASGHYAVEPMHTAVTACAAAAATGEPAPHEDRPSERCNDVQLGGSQFVTAASKADFSPTHPAPLWTAIAAEIFAPALQLASASLEVEVSIAHPPDAAHLSTIILLI